MEENIQDESQSLPNAAECILPPPTHPSVCRGLFPCSHGDNRRPLSVDLRHLARANRDLTIS